MEDGIRRVRSESAGMEGRGLKSGFVLSVHWAVQSLLMQLGGGSADHQEHPVRWVGDGQMGPLVHLTVQCVEAVWRVAPGAGL